MEIVSTIGQSHNSISGYNYEKFLSYVKSLNPTKLIITCVSNDDAESTAQNGEIKTIMDDPSLSDKVILAGVDDKPYESYRRKYFEERADSAEVSVKKNVLDLINSTVYSYLEGYWKDAETVNSDVTDSLFRAKHRLISAMFWDLEKYVWEDMNAKILENVERYAYDDGAVILSPVEKRYWFLDHL